VNDIKAPAGYRNYGGYVNYGYGGYGYGYNSDLDNYFEPTTTGRFRWLKRLLGR
ncbi:MAG: hypothetical protein RLZZ64_159, partial [Bacteroidota bacterium]